MEHFTRSEYEHSQLVRDLAFTLNQANLPRVSFEAEQTRLVARKTLAKLQKSGLLTDALLDEARKDPVFIS